MDATNNIALLQPEQSQRKPGTKRKHVRTKPQLLTRSMIDGRSNAAKLYDRLVVDIENDLGQREHLSTIQRALIEAFAGATVTLSNLNTRLLLGEKIDLTEHSAAINAMVKVATRLGIARIPRDIDDLSWGGMIRRERASKQQ